MRYFFPWMCALALWSACQQNPLPPTGQPEPAVTTPRTAPTPAPALDCDALDGRRYRIVFWPYGGRPRPDTLLLSGRRLHTDIGAQSGIPLPAYTCAQQPDGTLWIEGVESARNRGEMIWKGTLTGTSIEGLLQWTRGNGPEQQLPFTGELIH